MRHRVPAVSSRLVAPRHPDANRLRAIAAQSACALLGKIEVTWR
jgi:hypothetical protein